MSDDKQTCDMITVMPRVTGTLTPKISDIDLSNLIAGFRAHEAHRDAIDRTEAEGLLAVQYWLKLYGEIEEPTGWEAVCCSVCLAAAQHMWTSLMVRISNRALMGIEVERMTPPSTD